MPRGRGKWHIFKYILNKKEIYDKFISVRDQKGVIMSRKPRKIYESSIFHVIVQGIEKKYIFSSEEYMRKYFSLVIEKSLKYDVKILAYCIMSNHAHILIYVSKICSMSNFMRDVNTEYGKYYNKNEKRVGYVFRDRFVSEPITNIRYLYNCISYIHYNPVEANMVKYPHQYLYSSYNDYLYNKGIVTDECLKLIFGSSKDYIEMFKFIHISKEEFSDYDERDFIDYTFVKNIVDFSNSLESECLKLKSYGLSNRKIAELLAVGRNKVNKILKNDK